MAQALTTRTVEAAKPGKARKEIPDAHMPGLYLVLQPSGARSWAVRYRSSGRPRKYTIGGFPAIDLKTARDLASKALRAAAEGRDPGSEKVSDRAAGLDTVEAIATQFIKRHCARKNRPSTATGTERLLRQYVLPRWGGRLARDITRRDVIDLLDRIVDDGKPIRANRVRAAMSKMFNWCVERDILQATPVAGVKPPAKERPRHRALEDSELCAVWMAADQLGGPFGALVKLLILTGQRRDEVARMQWSEINLEARLWSLPPARVKNNQAHEIPLSAPAIAVLEALPRIGDRFVLTTSGETPSSNYAKNKRRLDALLPADMPPWRLHDARRTVASGMARIGINLPVIEKCLNHVSGSFAGIVSVYQRHTFSDEKRAAFDAWAALVTDLVSDEPRRRKVVRLHAEARR
jgi:integrase